ncbi:hypothetical protein OIU76_030012 [Salix suchowensis]|nr:hypothetical protein OIU76_030012 [Salix suchowensis]
MLPDSVESMVVGCTVMAMTESTVVLFPEKFGFSSCSEYLLPDTVKGLKDSLLVPTNKFPWLPDFAYKSVLEVVMFDNRVK